MSYLQKAILNLILATLTLVLTSLLWRYASLLILLLILVGIGMYFLSPSRSSVVVYLVALVFGPLAESIAMHSGAWSYANPVVLGFPLWLPFVWANTGLFIKNTADLSDKLFFANKK